MPMTERRARMPTPSRLQAPPAPRKHLHASNKTPATSSAQRRRREASAGRVARPSSEDDAERGAAPVPFRVQSATSAASAAGSHNLEIYSKRSCWQSFSRQKESVVLALDRKTLLSEVRILNKNACAVDVSLAVENKPRSFISVKRLQHMPHFREVTVKTAFFPCRFIKLDFYRVGQTDISVYGLQPRGVASDELEAESGASLGTVLSHTPEHLLFGPSLRASQPYMDCLSDHLSGSPEWMARHRVHLLDERIARLESALFPLR